MSEKVHVLLYSGPEWNEIKSIHKNKDNAEIRKAQLEVKRKRSKNVFDRLSEHRIITMDLDQ